MFRELRSIADSAKWPGVSAVGMITSQATVILYNRFVGRRAEE